MTTNIGTDDGAMPAKVLDNVRATSIIGLAKLVDDDHQYAAAMYAPTANGASAAFPARTRPKMSTTRPNVASDSDSHSPPDERWWVEMLIASRLNIRLASTAPTTPPASCAGR